MVIGVFISLAVTGIQPRASWVIFLCAVHSQLETPLKLKCYQTELSLSSFRLLTGKQVFEYDIKFEIFCRFTVMKNTLIEVCEKGGNSFPLCLNILFKQAHFLLA